MIHTGIVGAGNLGGNLACFIAEQKIGSVRLFDDNEGIATGKTLDMMEAAPVRQHALDISSSRRDQLLSSDIICLTAGKTLAEVDSTEALVSENTTKLQSIAEFLQGFPGVVIVASEPTEVMTTFVQKTSRLPRSRVLGVGTVNDALRLQYLIARQLGVVHEDVQALVIGTHLLDLIVLEEYLTVGGIPLSTIMEEKTRKTLIVDLKNLDAQHIALAKHTTPYYSSAAAVARIVEAIAQDAHRLLPVSSVLEENYGISDVAVGLPTIVTRKGASSILDIPLSKKQQTLLTQAGERIMKLSRRNA